MFNGWLGNILPEALICGEKIALSQQIAVLGKLENHEKYNSVLLLIEKSGPPPYTTHSTVSTTNTGGNL